MRHYYYQFIKAKSGRGVTQAHADRGNADEWLGTFHGILSKNQSKLLVNIPGALTRFIYHGVTAE